MIKITEEEKTLKDIKHLSLDFKNNLDYDLNDEGISKKDLRQEAIKWIKEGRETSLSKDNQIQRTLNIGGRLFHNILPIEEWIKHFFNITEDDLK